MATKWLRIRGIFPSEGKHVATMSLPEKLTFLRWRLAVLNTSFERICVTGHEITGRERRGLIACMKKIRDQWAALEREVGDDYYGRRFGRLDEPPR